MCLDPAIYYIMIVMTIITALFVMVIVSSMYVLINFPKSKLSNVVRRYIMCEKDFES